MNDSEKAGKFSVNLRISGMDSGSGLPVHSRSLPQGFKKRLVKTGRICYNSIEY